MSARTVVGTLLALAAAGFAAAEVIEVKIAPTPSKPVQPDPDPPGTPDEKRAVDLVICLDTSGSMTALIDSARARLWDIVNELATAKPTPQLRVGLLTYGSPSNSTAAQGWVLRQTDLTGDLDTLYAKMMGMTTNGGDEFVGWALNDALQTMSWSEDPDALKLIFVAGNESADQAAAQFNFRSVCKTARDRGITVNAIYAGDRQAGINEYWDQVGLHGGGSYHAISMEAGTVQIETPQDKTLLELNVKLNATYIPYGERGADGKRNQLEQDANAARVGEQSTIDRSVAKSTKLYNNAFWDLVDASDREEFDFAEIDDEALPQNMQSMTLAEKKAYVVEMKSKRAAISAKIAEVNEARAAFIKRERAKQGGATSLDEAILKSLREQAQAKGFTFE